MWNRIWNCVVVSGWTIYSLQKCRDGAKSCRSNRRQQCKGFSLWHAKVKQCSVKACANWTETGLCLPYNVSSNLLVHEAIAQCMMSNCSSVKRERHWVERNSYWVMSGQQRREEWQECRCSVIAVYSCMLSNVESQYAKVYKNYDWGWWTHLP